MIPAFPGYFCDIYLPSSQHSHFITWLLVKFIFSPPLLLRKSLCPALVVILGNPIHDKTITSAHSTSTGSTSMESDSASLGVSDHGRGSGCSCTAPTLSGPVARTIYYLATELVRLVGSVDSLKPVLQSLYHRMLLYPPPQHRVEAIKIMREVGKYERMPWFCPQGSLCRNLHAEASRLLIITCWGITATIF